MDHYEFLGIGRATLPETIEAAGARKRATLGAAGASPSEFAQVDQALRVLLDPELRDAYDATLGPGGALAAVRPAAGAPAPTPAFGDDVRLRTPDKPWHQRWWSVAILFWVPLVFWYAIYVFFAKLSWRERGAAFGSVTGIFATIFVVAVVVGVFTTDDLDFAENEYERDVILLAARNRDLSGDFGVAFEEVLADQSIAGSVRVERLRPIFEQYRRGLLGLRDEWRALTPTPDGRDIFEAGNAFWDFEIGFLDQMLLAETEEELFRTLLDSLEEETRLGEALDRHYEELLTN